jgi:hypothetical protein
MMMNIASRERAELSSAPTDGYGSSKREVALKIKYLFFLFALSGARSAWGQAHPVQVEIPNDFKLEMERTPCYGSCPVYTLSVDANGRVTYSGYKKVFKGAPNKDWLEKKIWRIRKAKVKELLKVIDANGYFSMRDLFDSKETGCKFGLYPDYAGVNLDISVGGKRVIILHHFGCFMCQEHYREFIKDDEEQSKVDAVCKPYEEHDRKVKKLFDLEEAIDRILEYKEHVAYEINQ